MGTIKQSTHHDPVSFSNIKRFYGMPFNDTPKPQAFLAMYRMINNRVMITLMVISKPMAADGSREKN